MNYSEQTLGEIVGEEVWRSATWLLLSLCGTLLATTVLGIVPYDKETIVTVPTVLTVTLTLSFIVYRLWTGSEARIL